MVRTTFVLRSGSGKQREKEKKKKRKGSEASVEVKYCGVFLDTTNETKRYVHSNMKKKDKYIKYEEYRIEEMNRRCVPGCS